MAGIRKHVCMLIECWNDIPICEACKTRRYDLCDKALGAITNMALGVLII
jgi:threonine dehydrogenase-like Zn-dependent dehydrogenase